MFSLTNSSQNGTNSLILILVRWIIFQAATCDQISYYDNLVTLPFVNLSN